MDFNKFPLAMKSCISHYELDLKQAAAFNFICFTYMLTHLEEPSLKKTLRVIELDKAKQVLLDKGGLGRLVMNLTGSGGSGKSFVLDAIQRFCFYSYSYTKHSCCSIKGCYHSLHCQIMEKSIKYFEKLEILKDQEWGNLL